MKIVTAKEFLEIKEPVVYQEFFDIYNWDELSVKGESINDNGFFYYPLLGQDIKTKEFEPDGSDTLYELLCEVEKTGCNFEREYEVWGREDLYEKERRFIVYDENDIKQLINALQSVITK